VPLQGFKPAVVIYILKILSYRAANQPPEIIARMPVILMLSERYIPRERSENEDFSIFINDCRKTYFYHA
jgi:hypothetical protein